MAVFMFPGQGSQKVGMGEGLFDKYPEITSKADEILGYSIKDLCLKDSNNELGQTQFTQPALYVVNALTYHSKLDEGMAKPTYTTGHSLGEYSALYASGSFDFETGLKLVQKRGEIMAKVTGGGMAAVIGLSIDQVKGILEKNNLTTIDIGNINSLTQVVLSGIKSEILAAQSAFEAGGATMYIPLNVSGAFHSRYMNPSREEFAPFIENFELKAPEIPVIANLTAKPYSGDDVKTNLIDQINHSVLWTETIQYLLSQGEEEFVEVGPGMVLSGLVGKVKRGQ